MQNKNLFRTEALEARQTNWLGTVILIRPLSFQVMTFAAAALASLVLLFIAVGTYTKRNHVSGQLVSNLGLVKVYPIQAGVVSKKSVTEGMAVKKGDVLYILSSERQTSARDYTQAAISTNVAQRRRSLAEERAKMQSLHAAERQGLQQKIAGLQAEVAKLDSQIKGQQSRVGLATKTFSRYQDLLTQNYISKEQTQQKQAELLDQENRLQELERDRISIGRELDSQRNEFASLPMRQQNQLGEIDRTLATIAQEFSESEAKRNLVVIAPQNGIATGVIAEVGQTVDSTRPLVSIIPASSFLQARLYAPSRTIGFIKPGNIVLLRYQAYPFEKFGHAIGQVTTVSRTALPADELAGIGIIQGNTYNEPLYTVTVNLQAQTILAYGNAQPLQLGMLLDADVVQETRKIYEWILDPLYSITGKL